MGRLLRVASIPTVALLVIACGEPALLRQNHKEQVVEKIRSALLSSAIAEKGAVLAVTDEESKKLADESESDAKRVDAEVAELRPLVIADGREPETQKLEAFQAASIECRISCPEASRM